MAPQTGIEAGYISLANIQPVKVTAIKYMRSLMVGQEYTKY
jgi:hypothetical protein